MILKERLIAIIITYNPDLDSGVLKKQISLIEKYCLKVVLIDNNSENKDEINALCSSFKKAEYVQLDKNYGIGYALNLGLEIAINTPGAQWLLTLDQDSLFYPETIHNAETELDCFRSEQNLACFGVNFKDLHFKTIKKQNKSGKPIAVRALITSGCFMNVEIVKNFRFKEQLFMYSIDTDFSYQLREKGYKLIQLYSAEMDHAGGKRKYTKNGLEVHYNDPLAFYYMSRNSIYLFKRYYDLGSFLNVLSLYLENLVAREKPIKCAIYFIKGFLEGIFENREFNKQIYSR